MSYNHASAFFLISLILFAAANPLAHGQFSLFRSLRVSGILCCTPTGICLPGSQPVSGAPVSLNCVASSGGIINVGTTTTGVDGRFTLTATNLAGIPTPINLLSIPCVAVVNLPLNATICPALSTVNGTLVGVVGGAIPLLTQIVARVLGFIRVNVTI